jgi:plasmid stabilization system protein ParE
VTRRWRLTPQAQESLVEIALWTIDRFGAAQAEHYRTELLERCDAIAEGRAAARDCSVLTGADRDIGLRFARAGEHFAVFLDDPDEMVIIDFLHARTDLPARIAGLEKLSRC